LVAVLVSGGEPSPGAIAVLGGTVVLVGALFSGGAQQLVWETSLEFGGLWIWWNVIGWLLGLAIAIGIPSAVLLASGAIEFGLRTGIGGAVLGLVTGWRIARESDSAEFLLPPQSGSDVSQIQ
jgi:hypothetical protein